MNESKDQQERKRKPSTILTGLTGAASGFAEARAERAAKKQAAKEQRVKEYVERKRAMLLAANAPAKRVTVTDIDMPFGSMVRFLVKLVLASIPAIIILFLIGFLGFFVLFPILLSVLS